MGGPVGRHEVYPEHERFFAEIYAIARPWQNMYSSHRDWISLTATNSTLLWDVLARAEQIGLPILLEGFEVTTAGFTTRPGEGYTPEPLRPNPDSVRKLP